MREVQTIRADLRDDREFKWSTITEARVTAYFRLIDALWESDARIAAAVVELSNPANPFKGRDPEWKVHGRIVAQLLMGNLNNQELGCAVLDERSTPAGVAFDEYVRNFANQRLGSIGMVSVTCADSLSTDGLQIADLIAGAVAHQRRSRTSRTTHKARVAKRLTTVFDVPDFSDQRTDRVNILTLRNSVKGRKPGLTSKSNMPRQGGVVEILRKAL